jgi:Transposase DDE domain
MDLETFIVVVFCLVDDFVRALCRGCRLRRRGPAPVLADSEVLAIEAAGEFLGLDTDRGLHAYFRRHFGHLFPGLRAVHRTTLLRQAANLWMVKAALWQHLAAAAERDGALVLVDSLPPVPVCRFARAHRCRSFRGLAAFGHDALAHQTYYGLRLHLRVTWPGVITAATLAPANDADRAVAPQLLAGLEGWALGDGGYWSPSLRAELADGGLDPIAPPRGKAARAPRWPAWLVQARRRIETVLSQLTERYSAKRVRARDPWHLAARWLRKLVSHTMAVLLCQRAGLSPLAFAQLIRA